MASSETRPGFSEAALMLANMLVEDGDTAGAVKLLEASQAQRKNDAVLQRLEELKAAAQ